MSISKDTVEYTAKLARLGLSEEEKTLYAKQLNDILGYVDVINSADTKKISPTASTRLSGGKQKTTPMRQDKTTPFKDIRKILDNAPVQEDNMFKVPKIMGDEEQ
ncbi:MAG: Asp-tRNA(Asn)/Glu-tRNA(Gln) amidotransferase subunit GatC [Candidatus Margulisiibacteriota bacterium]